MIERSLGVISNQNRRVSLSLRNDLRNSFRVERIFERNSLSIKSKLVEERGRTLKALALRSREQEKDKRGGVGGALGILGGSALGRRFFGRGGQVGLLRKFPKVPRSPSSLLRMQRGTSTLSRVGRVGRLGRVGPLAVVGAGLDFAGRRAEGQTNLQAGVGAAGGLGGALAGAKYGAILGTAVGGPIGTVIGGIGGSIIGGLAGGKLADLFTGADRRRRFEEQRVLISTQKSLFSNALDDLERVLNKLEDTSLVRLKKDDDRGLFKRDRFDFPLPKLPTSKPWYDTTAAKIIGYGLLLAGTLVLAGPSGEEAIPAAGLLNTLNQTRLGSILIKKIPALTKFWKKVSKGQTFADELVPGVDIPGISAKGIRIRAEALLKKINPNIKFDNVPKKEPSLKQLLKKEKQLQEKLFNIIKNASPEKAREILQKFIKEGKLPRTPRNIKKKGDVKVKVDRAFPSGSPDMTGTNSNPLGGGGTPLSMNELEPPNNDFIALAPEGIENNIFLMNNNITNNTTQPIVNEGGGNTVVVGGSGINTVDLMYLNAAAQQSMTA
ncbi:MAG: hypothetical protein CL761_02125 [Chloroflexi bacterium]|nr:hypothetical protein [Chloroflexota bacterium]|tara:strand:+ start:1595 stop:3247 length:1653 start_codon:yes stop_codon:yes gene_type:complete